VASDETLAKLQSGGASVWRRIQEGLHPSIESSMRPMSASRTQSFPNPVLRAVFWLLLKLALAASFAIGVGYLLGWPVWKMLGLALVVSLVIDVMMAWDEERRTARGEFELLNDMVGDIGMVTNAFVREGNGFHGRVRVRGESWAAVFPGHRALAPGERIQVASRQGLTLVIHPYVEPRTRRNWL
jgi:membrane protein implicated in regulation of membrane protease activity